MDRTAGEPLAPGEWDYDEAAGCVVVRGAKAYHDYTVSFLAYLIWDPVHMYNAVTNGWTNFEHQITFDVRQPKTHKFTMHGVPDEVGKEADEMCIRDSHRPSAVCQNEVLRVLFPVVFVVTLSLIHI